MKALVLYFFLLIGAGAVCHAQPTPAAINPVAATAAPALPDSVRQLVHKLFKRARLFGVLGTVSGGIAASSSTVYAANGDRHWTTIHGLFSGTFVLVTGTIDQIRFSHRRERQVLAALERGQPMPRYVTRSMPLLSLF